MARSCLRNLSLCLLMILILTGCNRSSVTPQPQPPTTAPSTPTFPSTASPTPTIPDNTIPSPLTGVRVDPSTIASRPIAVMIDNAPSARPHYGLSRADLFYEMLVEGGVTRIMAVFQSRSSDLIGPVRSVRPAFIEKAMELDAVLVHCGGSQEALDSIPILGIPDIDEIGWTAPFWRDPKRYAPHNLFTSSTNLASAIATRKDFAGSLKQPLFSFDNSTPSGSSALEVVIRYPGGYTVSYQYDLNNKIYHRLMNGQPHLDMDNNQALSATNLIIEVISVRVLDSEGRLRFDSVGKGDAYIITHGTLRRGYWVKESPSALTRFVDDQGNELTLPPGVTWVQQVTPTNPVEIK